MFKVTDEDIENLVNEEYENAVVEHGETYNTDHEFYAVLKEEVEEVDFFTKELEEELKLLWRCVKCNKTESIPKVTLKMEHCLHEAIKESLQCLAVIRKYKNKYL